MNDRQRLTDLLDSFGVIWTQGEFTPTDTDAITITAHDGPKNAGYHGFFTAFEFTPEGEFITVGAWE